MSYVKKERFRVHAYLLNNIHKNTKYYVRRSVRKSGANQNVIVGECAKTIPHTVCGEYMTRPESESEFCYDAAIATGSRAFSFLRA